jgi:hypothetical protein
MPTRSQASLERFPHVPRVRLRPLEADAGLVGRKQILDANLNVLLDYSGTVKGAGASHSTFSPGLVSSGAIHIRFGNTVNVGIDNINFDEIRSQAPPPGPVPEPGSVMLMAGGLGLLALIRRRLR